MTDIKLDKSGLGEILKSARMRALVKDAADQIAEKVNEQGIEVGAFKGGGQIPLPVRVETDTTDRAAASVLLAHPAGVAVQAKHGALTRAASALGLEVRDS